MSVAVGVSRILLILWFGLLIDGVEVEVRHRKNIPPGVDHVVMYSDVSEINSTTHAQFVPMFGAPGDIDISHDDGSTIRLRLESHSGMDVVVGDRCCRWL